MAGLYSKARKSPYRAVLTPARVGRYYGCTHIYIPPYAVPPTTLTPGSKVRGHRVTGLGFHRVTRSPGSPGSPWSRVTWVIGSPWSFISPIWLIYGLGSPYTPWSPGSYGLDHWSQTWSQGHHGLGSPYHPHQSPDHPGHRVTIHPDHPGHPGHPHQGHRSQGHHTPKHPGHRVTITRVTRHQYHHLWSRDLELTRYPFSK
jgi:hypothetical protein